MRGRVNLLLHKVIDSFILRLQELEGTNIIIAIVIARPPSIHPSLHLHISYGEELDEQRQQQSNMGLASATISSSDLIDAKLGARSTHCPGCGHKLVKPVHSSSFSISISGQGGNSVNFTG
ncbi:unnamed protein product [Linum trigynum]|uniref:Uncharacterized protein n=1 Tax=Linum trigynum TaxID=586398 RepID=A0AAV2DZC7_9ROSI